MTLTKLQLKPGIQKQTSDLGAGGGYTDCDNIRFRYGLPEKIGGWVKTTNSTLIGVVRDQHSWVALDGTRLAALGTNKKLYIYSNDVLYDITPLRQTNSSVSNIFTTANGTNVVTVNITGHNANVGDIVNFSGTTGLSGTSFTASDFDNNFEIQSITSANAFTIQMAANETTGTVTTGTATAKFDISIAPSSSTFGYGWGTSTWNTEAWNTPRSSSSVTLNGRDWSIDNFGELMIATVLDGSTFQWSPTTDGLTGRASAVTNAPTTSKFSLVSTPDRHLILFGTEKTVGSGTSQDPLLLRFSSQEDINTYQPAATNTAGSLRIQDGSQIVGADKARGQILVWTDTSLHGLQFIGPPFTFGLNQLGRNCGLLGQHSAVVVRDVAYWMGQNAFFVFDGTVKKLPCTVDDFVFENIDLTQTDQIFAGVNTEFAEIIWFYVTNPDSVTDPQVNKCVIYNYLEQTWTVGTLNRTSWVDRGVFQNPLATEYLKDSVANATPTVIGLSNGVSKYYEHESGTDADGSAMQSFIQSGDFNIDQAGEQVMRIARFIPDFRDQSGNLTVTWSFKNYPYGSVISQTASTVATTDTKKDIRGRGRQANFKIESNVANGNFKMGTFTIDAYPDGGR
tara:strand:+ start:81 stop:1946 length:1866 start_codon:yes stop_codon:yes gene_type:complete